MSPSAQIAASMARMISLAREGKEPAEIALALKLPTPIVARLMDSPGFRAATSLVP